MFDKNDPDSDFNDTMSFGDYYNWENETITSDYNLENDELRKRRIRAFRSVLKIQASYPNQENFR